jgi:two-component system sensor histidine kinase/response regulator
VSSPKPIVSTPSLPDAFPWGVALLSVDLGTVLYANKHMEQHYIGGSGSEKCIDRIFRFVGNLTFSGIVEIISAGKSWSGRAVPQDNKYGLSSVELMVHLDPDDASRVWIYTLENPSVDGVLRFSSRSEFQLLRVLLDHTLEYVFFRDTLGHFIIANRAFCAAVASDGNSSVVGQEIGVFVSAESAQWVSGIDQEIYETGVPSVNNESHFVFNGGAEHWLQMTTVPVRNSDGGIVGSLSVARDISELKRTESELRGAIGEAKAASRAKGEFLAAMSHEIRTPINGIVGGSELCLETQLDAEQQGYLDTVVQCSHTLLSLVNDVLDFSKIEAGQLNLERLSFNPSALLEDVVEEFTPAARKKGLELIVDFDETLPYYIMGDPIRLKQVIYNLIGNAVKFTEEGEIVLRAELLEKREQQVQLRFSVSDSGIGIAEASHDSIFMSFTQADMSTTRKYGGTGLGLSICKELVSLMGGEILVESNVGRGTTFSLSVPFDLSVNPEAEAVPFNPELLSLRVLIVDDSETSRAIYQKMCASWGYRSCVACDGREALAMLEVAAEGGDPYLLVLLDQQMPRLTGLDVAGMVLNRPELAASRILLLSSTLNNAEVVKAEQLGLARALSKPLKRQALMEVILETFNITGAGHLEGSAWSASKSETVVEIAPLHVLLAEDNLVNQQIAQRRLEKLGHTVVVAQNGLEAVEHVQSDRFDCVLMDMQMPEMDGYDATREIRRLEAQQGWTPNFIIAMTAHVMKGDAEKCLAYGMDEYISKPFRIDRLLEVLGLASVRKAVLEHSLHKATEQPESAFLQRLNVMGEENREDVMSVANFFSSSAPKDISKLELALAEQDFAQIGFIAHTMKGGAGIFSDVKLVELGTSIEVACAGRDVELARQLSNQFISSLQVLLEEVGTELERRAASSKPY